LRIVKYGSPNAVNPGDRLAYVIAVTNLGPEPARNLIIRDALPSTVRFLGIFDAQLKDGSDGVFDFIGGRMTATFPELGNGGYITITLQTQVNANATGDTLINLASVTATNDLNATNNAVTATVRLNGATPTVTPDPRTPTVTPDPSATTTTPMPPGEADLAIAQLGPSEIRPEQALIYTILITNVGDHPAEQVIVRDDLPVGVRFAGASNIRMENGLGAGLILGRRALTATIDTLYPQGVITITANTRLIDGTLETSLTNTATVHCTCDANPANNWSTFHTTVLQTPQTTTPTATVTQTPTTTPTPTSTPPTGSLYLPVVTR